MQRIIYTNELGESLELGFNPPFILQGIDGTGGVSVNHQTQKLYNQDGEISKNSTVASRPITLRASIIADNDDALFQYREDISRIFNPKYNSGVLTYITPNGTKRIDAKVDVSPSFYNYQNNTVTVLIELIALNPYWKGENSFNMFINTPYFSMFQFPLQLETQMGVLTESYIVTNNGNISSPLDIEIKSGSSEVTIEKLKTGEKIIVNRAIPDGSKLLISTSKGNKKIKVINSDGTENNGFAYLDIDSSFFQLDIGENPLRILTDSAGTNIDIDLKWDELFVGI